MTPWVPTAGRSCWPSSMPFRWRERDVPLSWPIRRCRLGLVIARLSPPTRLIVDFCRSRLPATMDCTLNLIDVRDVALGLVRVMERGKPGRRYLLGHENLALFDFLSLLAELTGVPVPRFRVPYPIALGVAWLSEFWADHVTGRSPRATVTGVRLARRTMHFDMAHSLAELGLRPRPIRESLADALAWLRTAGYLSPSGVVNPLPGECFASGEKK